MPQHPKRGLAIRHQLDQAAPPAQVAADLGVADCTLRGWLRQVRLKRELATQQQEQLVTELQQEAVALAELKRLLDREACSAAG